MSYRLLGDFKNLQCDMDIDAFYQRGIFLDCRAKVVIEQDVCLGFNISIITLSHDINDWCITKSHPVIIRNKVFIGSNSVLFNCEIGQGAVVAVGTVIRSRDIPPFTMVEGNPVRIIARKIGDTWQYLDKPEEIPIKHRTPEER